MQSLLSPERHFLGEVSLWCRARWLKITLLCEASSLHLPGSDPFLSNSRIPESITAAATAMHPDTGNPFCLHSFSETLYVVLPYVLQLQLPSSQGSYAESFLCNGAILRNGALGKRTDHRAPTSLTNARKVYYLIGYQEEMHRNWGVGMYLKEVGSWKHALATFSLSSSCFTEPRLSSCWDEGGSGLYLEALLPHPSANNRAEWLHTKTLKPEPK